MIVTKVNISFKLTLLFFFLISLFHVCIKADDSSSNTLAQEKNHILNESFKLLESDDVTTQIEGLKKLWENVNVKDNNILLLSTSFEKSSEVILTTINSFFELDKFLIKGNTSVSMLYYRLMVDVVDKTTDAAIQLKKEDLSHAGLSIAIELLEKVKWQFNLDQLSYIQYYLLTSLKKHLPLIQKEMKFLVPFRKNLYKIFQGKGHISTIQLAFQFLCDVNPTPWCHLQTVLAMDLIKWAKESIEQKKHDAFPKYNELLIGFINSTFQLLAKNCKDHSFVIQNLIEEFNHPVAIAINGISFSTKDNALALLMSFHDELIEPMRDLLIKSDSIYFISQALLILEKITHHKVILNLSETLLCLTTLNFPEEPTLTQEEPNLSNEDIHQRIKTLLVKTASFEPHFTQFCMKMMNHDNPEIRENAFDLMISVRKSLSLPEYFDFISYEDPIIRNKAIILLTQESDETLIKIKEEGWKKLCPILPANDPLREELLARAHKVAFKDPNYEETVQISEITVAPLISDTAVVSTIIPVSATDSAQSADVTSTSLTTTAPSEEDFFELLERKPEGKD